MWKYVKQGPPLLHVFEEQSKFLNFKYGFNKL